MQFIKHTQMCLCLLTHQLQVILAEAAFFILICPTFPDELVLVQEGSRVFIGDDDQQHWSLSLNS